MTTDTFFTGHVTQGGLFGDDAPLAWDRDPEPITQPDAHNSQTSHRYVLRNTSL